MSNDTIQEKRQSKRYLCDQFFIHCSLQTPEGSLDLTAIDFNREGIGAFSNEVIPESGDVYLSVHYENPSLSHVFDELPCTIVYCNLTEVGSHCGIRFNVDTLSEDDRATLESIETVLLNSDDPDDRYNLFGED